MKIEKYIHQEKMLGVSGLFFSCGSFGVIDGNVDYVETVEKGKRKYVYTNGQRICFNFCMNCRLES